MQGLAIAQLKGVWLMKLQRYSDAEAVFARVVERRRAVFGASGGLAVDLFQLSRSKLMQGRYAEAIAILREARPMAVERLGANSLPTLIMGTSLAEALAETGDTVQAEAVLAEIATVIEAMQPRGIPYAVLAKTRAVIRLKQGQLTDARASLDEAQAIFSAAGPGGESFLQSFPALRRRLDNAARQVR